MDLITLLNPYLFVLTLFLIGSTIALLLLMHINKLFKDAEPDIEAYWLARAKRFATTGEWHGFHHPDDHDLTPDMVDWDAYEDSTFILDYELGDLPAPRRKDGSKGQSCPVCGHHVEPDDDCDRCGAPLSNEAVDNQPPTLEEFEEHMKKDSFFTPRSFSDVEFDNPEDYSPKKEG
jgi:hypothetical protein